MCIRDRCWTCGSSSVASAVAAAVPLRVESSKSSMPYSAASDPFCHNGHQLPSLFLVGAMKCGTTSLAQQLFDEYGYSRGVKFPDSLGWAAVARDGVTANNRRL